MRYKFNVNINMMINTDSLNSFDRKMRDKIADFTSSSEEIRSYCYNSDYEEIWTKEDAEIYNKALCDVLEILSGMKLDDYCAIRGKMDTLWRAEDNE